MVLFHTTVSVVRTNDVSSDDSHFVILPNSTQDTNLNMTLVLKHMVYEVPPKEVYLLIMLCSSGFYFL